MTFPPVLKMVSQTGKLWTTKQDNKRAAARFHITPLVQQLSSRFLIRLTALHCSSELPS